MGTDTKKGKYATPEGSKTWEYLVIFICSIMSLCCGAIIGWDSPTIIKLMASDSPILVTASNVSTLVAMIPIGHILGPFINQFIVDRIGRRKSLLFSGIASMICWGLIAIAANIWVLYIAKFMGGLYIGQYMCVLSIYIGEIASPSIRGIGITLNSITFNFGILIMFIIATYVSISITATIWLIISFVFTIAFWFMPESPYYLIMMGKTDDAETSLEKFRGKMDVAEELQMIFDSISDIKQQHKKRDIRSLFTARASRRAFFISITNTVTHHIGGFFMMMAFAKLLFKSAQLQMISDDMANITIGVVQVISTTITIFLIDKLGRRPLILFSGVLAAASNLAIGVFFYVKDYLNVDVSAYSITLLIAAMLQVFAFNCGLLPLQLIMLSELFSTEIKASATCFVASFSGCFGVVAAKIYILIAVTWNYGHSIPYLIFFAVVTVCTILILRFLPETKGKTFVEIQKELND